MIKWLSCLCICLLSVQCSNRKQHIVPEQPAEKAIISLKVQQAGIWQPLGPFGSPEPMARKGEMSPHGAGRFMCVDVHPDRPGEILAGHATSGIFKTVDNGRTWEQKLKFDFSTGIFNIKRFKKNPSHLLICSALDIGNSRQYGYGLIESFDNGETWVRNSLQFEPEEYKLAQCRDVAIIDSKRILCISDKAVYLSEDAAVSWKKVYETSLIIKSIIVNPVDDRSMFICGNGVLYSHDGGLSWKDISTDVCSAYGKQPGGFGRFDVAFSQKTRNHFYLVAEESSVILLRGSTDSIGKFRIVNRNAAMLNATRLAMCTLNDRKTGKETLFVGTTRLFASSDEGLHFRQASNPEKGQADLAHDDINCLRAFGSAIYMATDGGVDVSKDAGQTWTSLTNGSVNLNASLIFGFDRSEQGLMMGGTQDNGILILRNGKWYCSDMYGDGGRAVAINDSTGFAVGYAQANYFTRNAGKSFEYSHAGSERSGHDFRMAYHKKSRTFFLANQHLYKKKEGKYFEILTSGLDAGRKIKAFWVNPENENEIWFCRDEPTWGKELKNKLYYTDNGGRIWLDYTYRLPVLSWRSITDIFINGNGVVAVTLEAFDKNGTEPNKVYFSLDGGLTFVNQSAGLPNVPANTIIYANREWICGTNNGVYVFRNNVWEKMGAGFPATIVTELKYFEDTGMLYASTFGRGMWGMLISNNPDH